MIKWAIKLNKYDISYQLRKAIKAQAPVEFINEATPLEENEGKWILHFDGSSTLIGNGVKVFLTTSDRDELEYILKFDFRVDYNVLVAGFRMTLDARARNLIEYPDSQFVTNKVGGTYEVKKD
ncbi:UNVERIFIED_CONTAM: hypothetical protein Sradi_4531600 [Sesamum radiatum]|uniref:Uncharacterized protein n=1 Tax=Sesamum radiatum TaxID=300843 RepID=A0AAW2NAV2_SESRA